MDFDAAINSHVAWKMKLSSYLSKPDHSLDAAKIEASDQCELGRWIAAENQKYSGLAEFAALRKEHEHFHKIAAGVVRKADAGQSVKEETALGAHSDFANASRAVVNALMALKNKLATGKAAAR